MRFLETSLHGVRVVETDPVRDPRGSFERGYCRREFEAAGLRLEPAQQNFASSRTRGTLRGLHYQKPPHAEAKLVRCVRGAIFDVVLDIRPESPTYLRWEGFELRPDDGRMVYAPEGVAHGYLTLEDDSLITYLVSAFYAPHAEGGVRWDDPRFAIDWPIAPTTLSDKDKAWPDFET
jgi:dTDP-4-dehydrorhamnose 3,5-epimerase